MSYLPAGFTLHRGWAAHLDLSTYIDSLPWEQRTVRVMGKIYPTPRLTAWLGSRAYTYSGISHAPTPMPEWLDLLARQCGRTAAATFNSVLGNLYRGGDDSVSWHADDEPELGLEPVIASLSLGAPRDFSVRCNASRERWKTTLHHGDLLVMSGRSQLDYQHAVLKTTRPVGRRVNLTFRRVGC